MSRSDITARIRRLLCAIAPLATACVLGVSASTGGAGAMLLGGALGLGLAHTAIAQPAAPPPPAARDEFGSRCSAPAALHPTCVASVPGCWCRLVARCC